MQRKLTAILSADVVGYSGLMEADESGTLERLKANRTAIFDPLVSTNGGRVFKLLGDGALAEFPSVVSAVTCALAIQEATSRGEPGVAAEKRIRYRIGVNLGDVIVDGDDIYGEGVNVAARLQTLAPKGGVAVSGMVRDNLEGKLACSFEDLGEHQVKDHERAVHAFGVRLTIGEKSEAGRMEQRHKPSICVLPFANMSGDAEQEYFSEGISEDIITDLSKVSALFVIARNTAFTFKGKSVKIPQVARELNVSHVLEGSVRKAGGRVRITAQLIDGITGGHIWAERYDRDLKDIFALQDEISEAIVKALRLRLLPEEKMAIQQGGTTNLQAFDLYLRGARPAFAPDELAACIALLEAATRQAPDYADAWGALAHRRALWRFSRPYNERDEIASLVSTEAERALALDPQNGSAMTALFLLIPPFGRFADMDALSNREEKNAPNDRSGLRMRGFDLEMRGHYLESVGRIREATEVAQSAFEVDPLNPRVANRLASTLIDGGRFEEARQILEATLARWPDNYLAATNLTMLSVHTQDWATVDTLLAPKRLAQFPLREFERWLSVLSSVMRDPSPQSRRRPIEAARRRFERSGGYAELSQLVVAAKAGAVDEAYAIAAKAKFGPSGGDHDLMGFEAYRTAVLFSSVFPEMRRDARFVKLCARLGLVDYWVKTKHWPDCVDEVAPHYDLRAECEKVAAGPPLPPANDKWCSPTP